MKKASKKLLSLALSAVMVTSSAVFPASVFAAQPKSDKSNEKNYVEGEAIVMMKKEYSSSGKLLSAKKSSLGDDIVIDKSWNFGNTSDNRLKSGSSSNDSSELSDYTIASVSSDSMTTKQIISKLNKNEKVKYAIPNYIKTTDSTDDTYSSYQWAIDNTGQNGGTAGLDVKADSVWSSSQSTDDAIVAIVDTGIDYTNEEFKDRLWVNPYGSKLLGKYGYDFSGTNDDGSPLDGDGHGTHVAGIIAAAGDNQNGISGINKSNVKIMALKGLDDTGSGDDESLIACLDYVCRAAKLGANIKSMNLSWGGIGTESEQEIYDMIFDELGSYGVVTYIAAGNDGLDISDLGNYDEIDFIGDMFMFDEKALVTPSSSESKYAVTVAASNEKDQLADFSNYSSKYVDVAAPGTDILSTVSYNCFNPSIYTDEQIDELTSNFNDFEGTARDKGFGEINLLTENPNDKGEMVQKNVTSEISNDYFGNADSGKSYKITTNDDVTEGEDERYIFTIPYTLDNKDDNYALSMMIKGNNFMDVEAFDIPASVDVSQLSYVDLSDYCNPISTYFYSDQDYWDHITYSLDVDQEMNFQKAAERQLVFALTSYKKGSEFYIDDLAVSKQGANSDDFGKYDFYNGTSMATPYATGAHALVSLANPDASAIEVINMVKNTGRKYDYLDGKVASSRVLSLDNLDKTPPLIGEVKYNTDNKVVISGDFKNATGIKINSIDITPISISDNQIIVPDNSYNTKKCTVEVANTYGTDTGDYLLHSKKSFSELKLGASDVYMGNVMIAGDHSYILDGEGTIIDVYYDDLDEKYVCDDMCGEVDPTVLFGKDVKEDPSFDCATYLDGSIYFVATLPVTSSNTGSVLGYEKVFGSVNIETETTKLICEIPVNISNLEGYTLATYNGSIYLIGGYDSFNSCLSDTVYKYSSGKLVKTSYNLPSSRAYGKCVQFKDKLVYAYGADKEGTMPSFLIFDGTKWTESKVAFNSEDYSLVYLSDGSKLNCYEGNVGYAANGIICNGAYVYGLGDTFTYNISADTVAASGYSYSSKIGESKLVGTTLPNVTGGRYGIFYGIMQEYYAPLPDDNDDIFSKSASGTAGDLDDPDIIEGYDSKNAFNINVSASYPKIKYDYFMDNCEVEGSDNIYEAWGNYMTVTAYPASGYVVTAITATDSAGKVKTYSVDSKNRARVLVTDSLEISAKVKKVAPNKVTSLKVKSATSSTYTLSWSKPSRAVGYQVQKYSKGKWTTVKTIKSANTTTYKISKQSAGTTKYRVRAYSVYNSKNYYGAYSSTLSVYVPSKQTISSLKAGSKSFTVNYKKNKSASGYQVQYSRSSKFTKPTTKTVTKNSTTSYKATKLSAKKKYYVRVRSYKTVNGQKVYGAWSSAKNVTTK